MVINDCIHNGKCNVGNVKGACCGTAQCDAYETMTCLDKKVDRFLGWQLPKNFSPDGGISFTPPSHPNHPWPVGTNLFDAEQAREMIKHVLGLSS